MKEKEKEKEEKEKEEGSERGQIRFSFAHCCPFNDSVLWLLYRFHISGHQRARCCLAC
jgi:hypothetical protein